MRCAGGPSLDSAPSCGTALRAASIAKTADTQISSGAVVVSTAPAATAQAAVATTTAVSDGIACSAHARACVPSRPRAAI
eukprot:5765033-Prymnesium_polylepis.1